MKSLYTIVGVLAAVALIGSIGISLEQQVSAITENDKNEIKKLTKDFCDAAEQAVTNQAPNAELITLILQYDEDVNEILNPTP
jgi:hypothetical protein